MNKNKQIFEVQNVKCKGCAHTLKTKLKKYFGEVDVDLTVMPRKISLNIDNSKIEELTTRLRSLGYPLITDKLSTLKNIETKAKSFVSCAVGKISEGKNEK